MYASATLEATMLMPFILMFFGFFVWIIDLFRVHAEIGNALNEEGRNLVNSSYAYVDLLPDYSDEPIVKKMISLGFSEIYLRNKLLKTNSSNKISNLSCLMSAVDKGGYVELKATYYVKPYVSIPGIKGILLCNSFYSKLYTGCEKETVDEYVFITKNSKVYHTNDECTTLKKTVKSVSFDELNKRRNREGKIYYPCEKCQKEERTGLVYVTPYGNRYHLSEECSEINITIFTIPKSEIGERRKCYYCP